jgi:hypothetical protein
MIESPPVRESDIQRQHWGRLMSTLQESSGNGRIGSVSFEKPVPGEMPHYGLPDDQLSHGANLANRRIWVNTRSKGAVERVFCTGIGKNLLGAIVVTYALPSELTISSSPEPGCLADKVSRYAVLEQDGVGTMTIFPFMQRHDFDLSGGLHVEETVLAPKLVGGDPPVVLTNIKVHNYSIRDESLLVTVYADLRGDLVEDLETEWDEPTDTLLARNRSHPDWVRLIGIPGQTTVCRTTHDVSESYAGVFARKIESNDILPSGPIGVVQIDLPVKSGTHAEVCVVAAVSHEGVEDARKWYTDYSDFHAIAKASNDFLNPIASASMVETPDPVINQGVFWAKVNMLKVISNYPEGHAFTNEPGVSSNVVIRDAAWFTYGCDFLLPEFSRDLLLKCAEKQYDTGKMPEYYDALDGHVEDYGISLNDDTPLFVLACYHHHVSMRKEDFLHRVYPSVKRAADYILDQRDEKGLVQSKCSGYEVHGIASWRNVIPDYQCNGAVTEINSECYAALVAAAVMGKAMGEDSEADKFAEASELLRDSINRHLLNTENGLYVLNIDSDGTVHTDVTADEVFPVLFNAAPPVVTERIVSRLRAKDFLTEAGLRTVSRNSPDYEPTKLVGLKGGVWPGMAFWYAFAAASSQPEFMVQSLHASYVHYLVDPLKNNTVPGQFSEWFDGESLVNRGMRLSPWEPPRLLWAAVEGLCGAKSTEDGYEVAPARPGNWKWLALRRMPCASGFLSFFATYENGHDTLYCNAAVKTKLELRVVGEDVTREVKVKDYRIHRAAFMKDGDLTICLGSEADVYVSAMLVISKLLDPGQVYDVRVYGTAMGWVDIGNRTGAEISQIAISIEDGEFRILTITRKAS